jgi:adenosylcobinamide amidohydrolase
VPLTDGAMVEAISIVAQARTAAIIEFQDVQRGTAITGTGTDCIVIASPFRGDLVAWAGLHTDVGEAVGSAVYAATRDGAEQWERDFRHLAQDKVKFQQSSRPSPPIGEDEHERARRPAILSG